MQLLAVCLSLQSSMLLCIAGTVEQLALGRWIQRAGALRLANRGSELQGCVQISSAFSQLLNLHNLSEEISQAQHERAVRMGEVRLCCAA